MLNAGCLGEWTGPLQLGTPLHTKLFNVLKQHLNFLTEVDFDSSCITDIFSSQMHNRGVKFSLCQIQLHPKVRKIRLNCQVSHKLDSLIIIVSKLCSEKHMLGKRGKTKLTMALSDDASYWTFPGSDLWHSQGSISLPVHSHSFPLHGCSIWSSSVYKCWSKF